MDVLAYILNTIFEYVLDTSSGIGTFGDMKSPSDIADQWNESYPINKDQYW